MSTKLAEPAVSLDNLGFLLAKASQRFNERLIEQLAEHGYPEVRASYGSVLMPLFEHDDLRVGEIGARARLSKQAMTRLVAQCEADGLVQRSRDAADGRAFRVGLTFRGQELRAVVERVLTQLDDEVLARVGRRQIDALRTALKGVMEL
jgi:DNA-binding MarR family transcriptional regulator